MSIVHENTYPAFAQLPNAKPMYLVDLWQELVHIAMINNAATADKPANIVYNTWQK